jgi:predicted AAA+ superfamily ATPase
MIKREIYLQKLRQLKDQNPINDITGIRQSGKSTLLEIFKDELISSGISSKHITF